MKFTEKNNLLLHICCASCGAYVSQVLKERYDVTLFYYNPNIFSESEYELRKKNVEKIALHFKLPVFFGDYDHSAWLLKIKGHEEKMEKGERCFICYEDRMRETARLASKNDFEFFTTTLTISPHKVAKQILETGERLATKYKLSFLDTNFKKKDGFKKSVELSNDLGLYRQNYCGCEFSLRS